MKRVYFFIRYSVLFGKKVDSFHFSRQALDYEDYSASLFSRSRLSVRFDLFKSITLKSLLGISKKCPDDIEFSVYLLTSTLLPEEHKELLLEIERSYDWFNVVQVKPSEASVAKVVSDCLLSSSDKGDLLCTVRLDDDDALCDNFLYLVSAYMVDDCVGSCVSFPRGFDFFYDPLDGRVFGFSESDKKNIALGLCFIDRNNGGQLRNVYALGNHKDVDSVVDVVYDYNADVYLRTNTQFSDRMYKIESLKRRDRVIKEFESKGEVDRNRLLGKFPFLAIFKNF